MQLVAISLCVMHSSLITASLQTYPVIYATVPTVLPTRQAAKLFSVNFLRKKFLYFEINFLEND